MEDEIERIQSLYDDAMARNPLNKELIQKLQDDASKLGVALALPKHILQLDATSQNHMVFAASQELVRLRVVQGEYDFICGHKNNIGGRRQ